MVAFAFISILSLISNKFYMGMIIPPFLNTGDAVAIIAPAKVVDKTFVENAQHLIENWGLKVVLGKYLFEQDRVFAGTDEQRAADLQWALDNPEIKAVICARGGYGTVRIIDRIDFTTFQQHPKWIAGFSDITVLHSHIHTHCNVATLHSTVPLNFPKDPTNNTSLNTLKQTLFGAFPNYTVKASNYNRKGTATGQLVGGNLSILHNLTGTNSDIDTKGKILFLEEVSEYAYHFDRMMWNLKKAGKLDQLAGLVVGGLTEIKQGPNPFGKTAEEIILEAVDEYDYPVCFDFPAGHQPENWCLMLGAKAYLSVEENVTLKFTPDV